MGAVEAVRARDRVTFDRPTRAAFGVLWRRLGFFRALSVGLAIDRQRAGGRPFGHLPPPVDDKERQSRDQIGPAIVLFALLVERYGDTKALSVTAEVVEAAALAFLGETVGPLRRAQLAAMDAEARDRFVRERMSRFPNAEVRFEHIGADEVRFTVTACRFVNLCHAAGCPELAPLFCAGDARFFGEVEPDVVLIRETTLAVGGDRCPFVLRYADEPSSDPG